jgi:acyl carrier protein
MDRRAKVVEMVKMIAKTDIEPLPDQSLVDSGLLDSFELLDLVGEIQKVFEINIPDSELQPANFDSISRIELYLETHR